METPSNTGGVSRKPPVSKRPAWSLVRSPARHNVVEDSIPDEAPSALKDAPHHPAVLRASPRDSLEGCKKDSNSNSLDVIRPKPRTSRQRKARELAILKEELATLKQLNTNSIPKPVAVDELDAAYLNPQYESDHDEDDEKLDATKYGDKQTGEIVDRQPVSHADKRPCLDMSVLSKLTPVGQIVTFRQVDIQPEVDIKPEVGRTLLTADRRTDHSNAAFDLDVLPMNDIPIISHRTANSDHIHNNTACSHDILPINDTPKVFHNIHDKSAFDQEILPINDIPTLSHRTTNSDQTHFNEAYEHDTLPINDIPIVSYRPIVSNRTSHFYHIQANAATNTAFSHDVSPINAYGINHFNQTPEPNNSSIESPTTDNKFNTEGIIKHRVGAKQKDVQTDTPERGEHTNKTHEMKVLSNQVSFNERLNGLVSNLNNLKRSKRRSDTEHLDADLRESVSDVGNLGDVVNDKATPTFDGRSTNDDEGQTSTAGVDKTHTEPFIYCRLITKYPKSVFLLTFAGHFLIAMATIGLLLYGYDLFPTDFETLPMSDWTVPWKKRDLAWRYRDDYDNRYVRKWFIQDQHKWFRSKDYGRASIVLYYDTGVGNIFQKENLLRMKEIEDRVFNIPEYRQYCVQTTSMVCQKPTSILRLFDGSFVFLDRRFFDPGFNNIPEVLYAANTNNYTKSRFAFFLSKDAEIYPTFASSPVTRSVFSMGYPLQMGEHSEKMEDRMEAFLVNHFKPVIKELVDTNSHFDVIYWSYLLFRHDIVIQIMYDCMFAVGSLTFIFLFIVYHTKSLWISSLSVFSILTSFLATNILYRTVLNYRYFGYFHVIAFFIILGIGVDDLFVFLDVWKSTEFMEYHSLSHRLSDAYRKSVLTMFFTSLTTAVAFFANVFSPLLAPQSFGTFAGLLVIVNYISVIVYFPNVLIIHHLYFKSWEWPCCSALHKRYKSFFNKNHPTEDRNTAVVAMDNTPTEDAIDGQSLFYDNTSRSSTGNLYNVVGKLNECFTAEKTEEYGFPVIQRNNSSTDSVTSMMSFKNNEIIPKPSSNKMSIVLSAINNFDEDNVYASQNKTDHVNQLDACDNDDVPSKTGTDADITSKGSNPSEPPIGIKKKKALVIFFRDYYFRFVTHWLIRWIIVVVLTGVVAFFAYCITKLETENEQVQLYRKSHNYGRALDLDFHYFVANEADRNVIVYIVWGLKPRDMSVCHFSDGRCEGREVFDETFDPNTPEAQLALKKFCDRLHTFTDEEIDYFSIRRHFINNVPEIRCFTDELDGYLREQSEVLGMNLSLPWTKNRMSKFMRSKNDTYDMDSVDESFTDTLQVPISYWLNDGYEFQDKSIFDEYHSLIGESISEYSTPLKSDMSVFVGNKIKYIGVQVNLTLGTFTSGYPLGKPAMDRWEKFVQTEMKQMPEGMRNGFQLTRTYWHSISVQKTMADNAIMGIVIGILFAFPILTLATQNILIALCAIICMCCSTICVIGVIPLAGWKLGILESLNMCMVVGLTVDFVVHLSEGYHISTHTDRESRVRDMLELMGISIFSGACTTLGASLFMVFAQIQFIIRFGIFMFCTIGFSLIYSLGLFTTLMGILGPNGQTGDISTIYNACKRICWKRK